MSKWPILSEKEKAELKAKSDAEKAARIQTIEHGSSVQGTLRHHAPHVAAPPKPMEPIGQGKAAPKKAMVKTVVHPVKKHGK